MGPFRREVPVHECSFSEPTNSTIDRKLLGGSALFGLGWGLSGVCPGPGLVSFSAGAGGAGLFIIMMFAGFTGYAAWSHHREKKPPVAADELPAAADELPSAAGEPPLAAV